MELGFYLLFPLLGWSSPSIILLPIVDPIIVSLQNKRDIDQVKESRPSLSEIDFDFPVTLSTFVNQFCWHQETSKIGTLKKE